ncbi:MAG: O-antigen ligase family protein [Burkholderiales bacterium]
MRLSRLVQPRPDLRYPIEFAWLLAFVFFLPLVEVPKNLCWLAYVLAWLSNRARDRDWGGRWDRWDALIALWIVSGYVVAAFAGIHRDEWGGANDILRYGSVLWLVKRSRYDERALLWILGTIVASTLITLAWGYWRLYVTKVYTQLQLNSVGHVNHSAIYMAIVFGLALSFALAYWGRMGVAARVAAGLAAAVLIVSVFVTQSRAAALAAVLFVIVLAVILGVRRRRWAVASLAGVLAGMAVMLALNPAVLQKNVERIEENNVLAFRDKIWKNGLVEWRRFPLFGVGMGNFGHVSLEQLQDWNKTQDWPIRPSAEGMNSHGHSIYVTALAERGLVGFGVLMAVLIAWVAALVGAIPRPRDPPLDWTLFGAALAGWFVTVVVGFVNTTLHHEHAILSVLLLGLWLGHRAATVSPGGTVSLP